MRQALRFLIPTLALVVGSSSASAATLVDIHLESGSEGGFGFSTLHSAEGSCTWITDYQFCMNGRQRTSVSGVLHAEQHGLVLQGIQGELALGTGSVLTVSDGVIDLTGEEDEFGSFLETDLGTFHFYNHSFAGPANGFDGESLRLWGNNWSNEGIGDPGGDHERWGLDLGGKVGSAPVPEPGAALAFGLGTVILRSGLRRRRARA